MKRAAIFIIVVATLVLVGYPSAPSLADTPNSVSTGKSSSSGVVTIAPGGSVLSGSGDSGGGSNEGDADGLSGLKGRPPVATSSEASAGVARVMMMLEQWWKFMVWSR
ncbi:MAG: hypothetical protein OEX18_03260 [Candidatus Krumholzibacteria bacterium]|nr:hypothetical protein [Candidatus Krumholzibacteria bacterium]MDH4336277.1 hypothetical protein [Candidatus Krumholzibacteria bacterium]MDH5269684.1 hypothetical protein [Candidatus Krumholzibacteria bacterium]MDH5627059.1 hypothetical protein [Candidatus Krumholzibacteria bacterium]